MSTRLNENLEHFQTLSSNYNPHHLLSRSKLIKHGELLLLTVYSNSCTIRVNVLAGGATSNCLYGEDNLFKNVGLLNLFCAILHFTKCTLGNFMSFERKRCGRF